jgi:carboxyl-terminal processing protease
MNWRKGAALLLIMTGWFAIGWLARGLSSPPPALDNPELALVAQAGEVVTTQSFGPTPQPRQLTYSAIRGMLDGLHDPYATFFDPVLAARNRDALAGHDASLGIRGEYQSGVFTVTRALPDMPAQQAGLQPDDVILEIDGWPVAQAHSESEVLTMLRGPLGSTARLVVQRAGQPRTFEIVRQPVQEIITDTIDSDIAYIRLDRFSDKSPALMQQALDQLITDRTGGLIWDLRRNGGGLMESTRQVLDLFLAEGVAFYARTDDGALRPFNTSTGSRAEKIPLVVLIGPATYSAPETVAAAIRDRQRGTLIGETTYGKGAIVSTFDLRDGSAIRLTVAQWLSPVQQESFEGRGVAPDIVIQSDLDSADDEALRVAVEYLRQAAP